MKKIWVSAVPWNKQIVTTAIESGVDALLVPQGYTEKVKQLGIIHTIAPDGDLKLGEEVIQFEIKDKADEEKALELSRSKILILHMADWKIIPLENLVAQTEGLIVQVKDAGEAMTAIQTLEKGADGVLLKTTDLSQIKKTAQLIRSLAEVIELETAKITTIKLLGMGDRVCIDSCTSMIIGEGMLVGNSSAGMFLVHSESVENPYVEPRPFRVNAGAVHAYVLAPDGKTRYLSELSAGDEILIVNYQGKTQKGYVGRIKTERRPLVLVKGESGQKKISLILQNAETIRLTQPDGNPVSIVDLKPGSEVLAYTEKSGRHFGTKIEETITEK